MNLNLPCETAPAPVKHDGSAVYFVGAAGANLVKIGYVQRADRFEHRLNVIRTCCPYPVVPLYLLYPAGRSEEFSLHARFKRQQFHGEWFRWDGELAQFLTATEADPVEAGRKMLLSLTRLGD